MNETYFSFLPLDLTSYIQLYVDENSLSSWCALIPYCNKRIYWQYFYSYFIKDWNLILNSKPDNSSFLEQYKKLIKLNSKDIFNSIEKGMLDNVVYLIEKGAIYLQVIEEWIALMIASAHGKIELVKYLIDKGVNIDLQDNIGWTVLMIASKYGNLEIVKYLIEKGASLNLQNNEGETALMIASRCGFLKIVKYLESFQ